MVYLEAQGADVERRKSQSGRPPTDVVLKNVWEITAT